MASTDLFRDVRKLRVLLQRQHARIAALLEHALAEVGVPKRAAVTELTKYVALHEAAEQTFLHPVGLGVLAEPETVQRRITEEQEIDVLFTRLEGMPIDSVDFMIELGLLEEALLSHGRAEEDVELVALGQATREPELERVAQSMALVDEWDEAEGPGAALGAVTYGEQRRRAVRAFASEAR